MITHPMAQEFENLPRTRVVIAGIGGGGCRVLDRLLKDVSGEMPDAIAISTDTQALESCAAPFKVRIGDNITQGLGAGGDPTIGRIAAQNAEDRIRQKFAGRELVCLLATLGGGTGSGAAPEVARIAREEGAMVMCFVTSPFDFEGAHRSEHAAAGLDELRRGADAVIYLPNDRLLEVIPHRTSLTGAFEYTDRMLSLGVRSVLQLVSRSGIVNLDFSDIRSLMERSGGVCVFAHGEGEGRDKSDVAVAQIVESPLLDHGAVLAHAKTVLVSIAGGKDLTLDDVQKTMSRLKSVSNPGARVVMSAIADEALADRMALTVLVNDSSREASTPEPSEDSTGTDGASPDGSATDPPKTPTTRTPRAAQQKLNLNGIDKKRFRGTNPSVVNGEDLDVPTFIRRGIRIDHECRM